MERPLNEITATELLTAPAWSYTPSKDGRVWLKPVGSKRLRTFNNRMVTCQFHTPSGEAIWGLVEGIHPDLPLFSKHWRKAYLLRSDGKWFELARYHDYNWSTKGPERCAYFFRSTVHAMFPLRFDISHLSATASSSLVGVFESDPKDRLPRAEIIALAVPGAGST